MGAPGEPLPAPQGRAVLRGRAAVPAGGRSGNAGVRLLESDPAPARAGLPLRAARTRRPRLLCGEVRAESRFACAARARGSRLRHRLRRRALPRAAGRWDARKVVFSGVGKRQEELAAALDAGIFQFNCESEEELQQLSRIAARKKRVAPVALRVNPEVDARTHPHIATALSPSKFGIPAERVLATYRLAASLPGIRAVGVACHIGSQIASVKPFAEAAEKMRALVLRLRED